ncbi:MAG TPA: hypothetical protein VK169_22265 [Saprospiraceae bacterium]|nr:hypothetical protein [Saprospiraceae bacterium]
MANIIDKELLKQSLKELMVSDPNYVSELIIELSNELKKKELEKIVADNFKEYDQVFKALA